MGTRLMRARFCIKDGGKAGKMQ
ncbi:uncharacterized protein G2W53_021309 [Senna tora]|uniref:Uncharacterized protein n=1 Tax=Senna tora TaxID=362788 RepID=A0A834TLM3_9FABA|nr:uncharacterized protein G2W53_021309 [Senna tora]